MPRAVLHGIKAEDLEFGLRFPFWFAARINRLSVLTGWRRSRRRSAVGTRRHRTSACSRTSVLVHATVLPPIDLCRPTRLFRATEIRGWSVLLSVGVLRVCPSSYPPPSMHGVCGVLSVVFCGRVCVGGCLPPHHACQARPPPSAAAAQASWPICLSRKRSAFLNSTTPVSYTHLRAHET